MSYFKSIWFIIVTYYPSKATLIALRKALAGCSIIEADNTLENFGYGGGANVGIRYATEHRAQWIIVLNQDVVMKKATVHALYKQLQTSPAGIAGTFVGSLDLKRWTTILPSRKVDYVSGSCIAIHKDVFEKIGYFYEPYFMYYEDADLCIRAKKAGFPLIHVTIPGISHTDTTSLGRGSFLHQYYLARNHLLFVERNAPLEVKIHEIVRLPKTIWEHWRKKEWGALTGIRDYFLRRFGQYKPLW